jgi:hypothetical protein
MLNHSDHARDVQMCSDATELQPVIEDYDPTDPCFIQQISESEVLELQEKLLQQQICALHRNVTARRRIGDASEVTKHYEHVLRVMMKELEGLSSEDCLSLPTLPSGVVSLKPDLVESSLMEDVFSDPSLLDEVTEHRMENLYESSTEESETSADTFQRLHQGHVQRLHCSLSQPSTEARESEFSATGLKLSSVTLSKLLRLGELPSKPEFVESSLMGNAFSDPPFFDEVPASKMARPGQVMKEFSRMKALSRSSTEDWSSQISTDVPESDFCEVGSDFSAVSTCKL